MSTKSKIVLGIGGLLTAAGIYKLVQMGQKASAAKKLKPSITDFELGFDKNIDLATKLTSAREIPIKFNLSIANYTPHAYRLQQMYIELQSPETSGNVMLAAQTIPLNNPIDLAANQVQKVPMSISLATLDTIKYFAKGLKITDVLNFLAGGKLNKKIILNGFLRVDGVNIPLNENLIV